MVYIFSGVLLPSGLLFSSVSFLSGLFFFKRRWSGFFPALAYFFLDVCNGVYGFSDPEETNYALSKAGFAELCTSLQISEEAVIAFTELFKEIRTILEFDQKKVTQKNK